MRERDNRRRESVGGKERWGEQKEGEGEEREILNLPAPPVTG